MNICKKLYIILFISLNLNANLKILKDFINNYTRPVTVLEIGLNSCDLIPELAKAHEGSYIAMFLKKITEETASIYAKDSASIVVTNPVNITATNFNMLGKCEHFDVVIIHDVNEIVKNDYQNYIPSLLSLGDHIFFEIKNINDNIKKIFKSAKKTETYQTDNGSLLYCYMEKKGLELPRWTLKKVQENNGYRYTIISDFNKKFMIKPGCAENINWIPGINLKTFVMLRGLHPNDAIIGRQLLNMKNSLPYHNDLIIGNIVIQGILIKPIDFDDKRRDANMNNCINRALRLFNGDNSRLINPEKRIKKYTEED